MKHVNRVNRIIRGALAAALLASLSTFALAGGVPAPETAKGKPDQKPDQKTDEKADADAEVTTRAAIAEKRARDELENARLAMKRFAKAPNPSAGLRYLVRAEKALRIARDRSRGLALDVAHEIDRKATPALVANLIKQSEIHLGRGAEKAARRAIDAALAIEPRNGSAQRMRDAVARAESDDEPDVQGGAASRRRLDERRLALRGRIPIPSFEDRWNARRPNPFR